MILNITNDVIELNILALKQRSHRRWSSIVSGTLDFNEFLSLLLVYRQTDGFSHKDASVGQGVTEATVAYLGNHDLWFVARFVSVLPLVAFSQNHSQLQ